MTGWVDFSLAGNILQSTELKMKKDVTEALLPN